MPTPGQCFCCSDHYQILAASLPDLTAQYNLAISGATAIVYQTQLAEHHKPAIAYTDSLPSMSYSISVKMTSKEISMLSQRDRSFILHVTATIWSDQVL